jgi:hypothetical protein
VLVAAGASIATARAPASRRKLAELVRGHDPRAGHPLVGERDAVQRARADVDADDHVAMVPRR